MHSFAQIRLVTEKPVDHHFCELDIVEELVQVRKVNKHGVCHVFLHCVRALHVKLLAIFDESKKKLSNSRENSKYSQRNSKKRRCSSTDCGSVCKTVADDSKFIRKSIFFINYAENRGVSSIYKENFAGFFLLLSQY